MNFRIWLTSSSLAGAAPLLCIALATGQDSPAPPDKDKAKPAATALTTELPADDQRVSVATARDRATLLHNVYVTTLEMMHDRYFHDERAIVPARALEDVFAELTKQSQIKARWISVNTKPMSIQHEPKSDFEKQAAKKLADGQDGVELVEDGYYYRAGAVPLTSGCIGCHTGFFASPPTSARFAGLVIGIPVQTD